MLATRIGIVALALAGVACDAIFGDTKQCSTDTDCAGIGGICSADGICGPRRGGGETDAGNVPGSGSTSSSGGAPDASAPTGAIASLEITPASVSVAPGQAQTFTAVAKDGSGNPVSPTPTLEWSVSGGGMISSLGVFTAGPTAGGPFTVTAKAGAITATASVTIAAGMTTTVTIGETTILTVDDSGNANLVLAQEATLAAAATLKSLTFYVDVASGKLRLGLYDATGPNGGPGALKAATDELVTANGWMTAPVKTPVLLPAGNYWLAYAPETNGLGFHKAGNGTGKIAYFNQAYGPLPATFSTTPTVENEHWSFYATLTK